MREIVESLIHMYESALVIEKYHLTCEEFIYLFLIAEGHEYLELMDYFDCQKGNLYKLRSSII